MNVSVNESVRNIFRYYRKIQMQTRRIKLWDKNSLCKRFEKMKNGEGLHLDKE